MYCCMAFNTFVLHFIYRSFDSMLLLPAAAKMDYIILCTNTCYVVTTCLLIVFNSISLWSVTTQCIENKEMNYCRLTSVDYDKFYMQSVFFFFYHNSLCSSVASYVSQWNKFIYSAVCELPSFDVNFLFCCNVILT